MGICNTAPSQSGVKFPTSEVELLSQSSGLSGFTYIEWEVEGVAKLSIIFERFFTSAHRCQVLGFNKGGRE